jgi:hypothetical protein
MAAHAALAIGQTVRVGGRARRMTEVTLFVGAWMATGLALRLDGPRYQLVGVPLTMAFQLLVRRRPLRQLWVRAGPAFRPDARSVALRAATGARWPARRAVSPGRLRPEEEWPT